MEKVPVGNAKVSGEFATFSEYVVGECKVKVRLYPFARIAPGVDQRFVLQLFKAGFPRLVDRVVGVLLADRVPAMVAVPGR